jgi:hypothetical protein
VTTHRLLCRTPPCLRHGQPPVPVRSALDAPGVGATARVFVDNHPPLNRCVEMCGRGLGAGTNTHLCVLSHCSLLSVALHTRPLRASGPSVQPHSHARSHDTRPPSSGEPSAPDRPRHDHHGPTPTSPRSRLTSPPLAPLAPTRTSAPTQPRADPISGLGVRRRVLWLTDNLTRPPAISVRDVRSARACSCCSCRPVKVRQSDPGGTEGRCSQRRRSQCRPTPAEEKRLRLDVNKRETPTRLPHKPQETGDWPACRP